MDGCENGIMKLVKRKSRIAHSLNFLRGRSANCANAKIERKREKVRLEFPRPRYLKPSSSFPSRRTRSCPETRHQNQIHFKIWLCESLLATLAHDHQSFW